MLYAAAAGLLLATGAQAASDASPRTDPLSLIAGDWQVIEAQTGRVVLECPRAQRFEVTPDRQNVILTQLGVADWSSRYRVIRADGTRLLMIIENEERRTAGGEPVRWWAQFNGTDEFSWRRDDWEPGAETNGVWRRCNRS